MKKVLLVRPGLDEKTLLHSSVRHGDGNAGDCGVLIEEPIVGVLNRVPVTARLAQSSYASGIVEADNRIKRRTRTDKRRQKSSYWGRCEELDEMDQLTLGVNGRLHVGAVDLQSVHSLLETDMRQPPALNGVFINSDERADGRLAASAGAKKVRHDGGGRVLTCRRETLPARRAEHLRTTGGQIHGLLLSKSEGR